MKIVLSDNNIEFRQGLKSILERAGFEIVGEAENGLSALHLIEQINPDIAILEMNSLRFNCFEVSREIIKRGFRTKVIMLSMFLDDTTVLESFRAGIKAFVLKTNVSTDIVMAIHQLERCKHFMSPAITDLLVESYQHLKSKDSNSLNELETEILRMLAQDKPKNDIARQLSITVECLEIHRKTVMVKLHASNIGGLIRHAVRKGMILA